MENYEGFKQWLGENKTLVITGLCMVIVFFVGFGTGRYARSDAPFRSTSSNNYTTKPTVAKMASPTLTKVVTKPDESVVLAAPATPTSSLAVLPAQQCLIKGNIASGGKKIYHVPGGASYNIVKPEQCFTTETEAETAGFVKAKR